MINKLNISNKKVIEYIKNTVITTGDKETIYSRDGYENPKMTKDFWLLDFRKMFVDSNGLELISNTFWDLYGKHFPFQIAFIELGSVPLSGAILLEGKKRGYDVKGLIVRKSRKKRGLGKIIEGTNNGEKVILIDDLFNSGATLFQAIEILRDHNINIFKIFCIARINNPNFEKIYTKHYPTLPLEYLYDLKDLGLKKEKKYINKLLVKKTQVLSLDNPNKVLVVAKSSPLIDKKYIFLPGEGGTVKCIDKNTFEEKWSFQVNLTKNMKNILSSPISYGENIIFGSYDGTLYCLNKETGKQVFYNSIADWIGSTADFSKDKIYIGLEHFGSKRGSLACVDPKNGDKIWEYYVDDYIHSSPIYIEKFNLVICGSNCGKLLCLDATTGEKKWILSFTAPIKSGFKFIEQNNSIVFGCFDYSFYQIDVTTGNINWSFKTGHLIYATPLVFKNNIFFGSIDRNFYHLDINGNLLGKYVTGGRIFAQPILYKNKYVIFCSNDMKIYFYNIEKKETLMYIQHSERITNRISYENNKLYFLDFMNKFYIIDLTELSYLKVETEND